MNKTMQTNEALHKTWQRSRAYTLSVAEAMPEADYDFKPTEEVWSFRELMQHIAYSIGWWEDNYIRGTETEWAPPAAQRNKQQVLADLAKAYDHLEATLQQEELAGKALHGFHATADHVTHHRAQAVTYLRCKGVTAPEYTY